jgi:YVTN family beta-propeller protein
VGNTISVIDPETNAVVNTITVGDKPANMEVDSNDNIWLICNGLRAFDEDFNRTPEDDTPGALYVIDAESQSVIESQTLDQRPNDIALNEQDGRAYILDDNIDVFNLNTYEKIEDGLIDRSFNAVGYAPGEQIIYAGQSRGLTQNGQALQFNTNGMPVDSFEVGISPIEFEFVIN